MTPQQYNQKFDRIASQTSYRLLGLQEREFLKNQALKFRFTLQELQLVSDMALDRMRWKEAPISDAWRRAEEDDPGFAATGRSGPEDKKRLLGGVETATRCT